MYARFDNPEIGLTASDDGKLTLRRVIQLKPRVLKIGRVKLNKDGSYTYTKNNKWYNRHKVIGGWGINSYVLNNLNGGKIVINTKNTEEVPSQKLRYTITQEKALNSSKADRTYQNYTRKKANTELQAVVRFEHWDLKIIK